MKQLSQYINETLKNAFEIDEKWMKSKYDEFNKIYFDKELPSSKKIGLRYERLPKNTLGFQGYKESFFYHKAYMKHGRYIMLNKKYQPISSIFDLDPYIALNSLLNATENQWEDTLIHEMVHLYTYKDCLAPKQAHGPEFRAKCDWIRRKAKEEYGKDYELEIYAKRETEYELKDDIKKKISNSNRYVGVVSVYIEMNDKIKITKWPHQYRFFFCKVENYDKIISDIMRIEKQYIKGIYRSFNTYEKMSDKYGDFPIVRTYKYWPGDKYELAKKILKVGKNLYNVNEEKKEYVKPEMTVYEIPGNINLSDVDLEDIIKLIDKEEDIKSSKENEKNMIEVK